MRIIEIGSVINFGANIQMQEIATRSLVRHRPDHERNALHLLLGRIISGGNFGIIPTGLGL